MAGPPNANEIKSQLAALLLPVIGTSATFKTKIIDTMQFPFGRGADPTALRSELDEVVLFEGVGPTRSGNIESSDEGRLMLPLK